MEGLELTLGLPGINGELKKPIRSNKRSLDDLNNETNSSSEDSPPVAKAQVVGWPPVHSYRKNAIESRKTEGFVKVSMDGAPYLRKIDLNMYKGYKDLREALEKMFKCFEKFESLEYEIAYEDKDEDWMLVGDVPWGMFVSACKRLRIMRRCEARGLGSNLNL